MTAIGFLKNYIFPREFRPINAEEFVANTIYINRAIALTDEKHFFCFNLTERGDQPLHIIYRQEYL